MTSGEVITGCKGRHRHQEFLAVLKQAEANAPADLDAHLVVDNCATHKHVTGRRWLAARPRWHSHYMPTYASWLNQVETRFNIITQKAIRSDSFSSVKELVVRTEKFVLAYNRKQNRFPGRSRLNRS